MVNRAVAIIRSTGLARSIQAYIALSHQFQRSKICLTGGTTQIISKNDVSLSNSILAAKPFF